MPKTSGASKPKSHTVDVEHDPYPNTVEETPEVLGDVAAYFWNDDDDDNVDRGSLIAANQNHGHDAMKALKTALKQAARHGHSTHGKRVGPHREAAE